VKKERGHVTDFGVIDIRGIVIFEKRGEKLGAPVAAGLQLKKKTLPGLEPMSSLTKLAP